jgi:hypothetical protein
MTDIPALTVTMTAENCREVLAGFVGQSREIERHTNELLELTK